MKPNKAEEKFKTHPLQCSMSQWKVCIQIGLIPDKKEFDKGCLVPKSKPPE